MLAGQSNPIGPGEGRTAEDCASQNWALHSSRGLVKGRSRWWPAMLLAPPVFCWCRSCHPVHTPLTWPVAGKAWLQCRDSEVESTVTVVWHLCKLRWLYLNQKPAMSECRMQLGEAFRHALFISVGVMSRLCLCSTSTLCLDVVALVWTSSWWTCLGWCNRHT